MERVDNKEKNKKIKLHFSIKYFVVFMLMFTLEVFIAFNIHDDFVRPLVGDFLVVGLIYACVKSFVVIKSGRLPLSIFLFAVAVEISQGLGLVNLIGLGESNMARVILGTTFDIRDIVSYGLGCFVIWLWDSKRFEYATGIIASNGIALLYVISFMLKEINIPLSIRFVIEGVIVIAIILLILRLHIQGDFKIKNPNVRLKALMGGRKLIQVSFVLIVINSVLFYWLRDISQLIFAQEKGWLNGVNLTTNYLLGIVLIISFYLNGMLRVVVLSRRLGPSQRGLSLWLMFVPVFNIIPAYIFVKKAYTEYDHECYKVNMNTQRVESQICATRYPLLMLHGVGFRDLKYVNYWGRIPGELIKNGSKVYYGHQEAWGTIEDNGLEIKNKIYEIMEKENCDKVNIIAHSKGGLDGRYVVSQLDMGKHVASLTMIGAPHRGSEVLEFVEKLPKGLVNFIGNMINKQFLLMGDKAPNFHVASKQFLIHNSESFNEKVVDFEGVYYQSYATLMKTPFSDPLLTIPYLIVRIMGSKNDGLVTIDSAKWGDFKGVVKADYHRGISHGDIIDLKREDYNGFDVREFYVQLVNSLKESGY